jgi:hypothetical protein
METHKNICADENMGTHQRDIDGFVPLADERDCAGWVTHVQNGIGPSDRALAGRQFENVANAHQTLTMIVSSSGLSEETGRRP